MYNAGYFSTILNLFSFMCITFALLVITVKNPVKSVLFLIGLFFSIACYLISIGLSFIGISYLLVYVGAVSILFLFILMLINIRVSELTTDTKNSIPLVLIVGSIFYVIFPQSNLSETTYISNIGFANIYNNMLSNAAHNNWENTLIEFDHITSIANVMYTSHSILLIFASIILLLAMLGAIVITIRQKPTNFEEKNIKVFIDFK